METVKVKPALPEAIASDAEFNAFKRELSAMHDAFAADDMDNYDDDRFRAIVHLMRAYHPPLNYDNIGSPLGAPFQIESHAEYRRLMAEYKALGDPNLGTPEYERYEALSLAIVAYEKEHYPPEKMFAPDAVDIILSVMDAKGLRQIDLVPFLGGQNRVSEVLNRKRPLTVKMMRALHDGLGISYDDLMRE